MLVYLMLEDCHQDFLWEKVHLDITFIANDKRRRDLDNLIASCKPWIDALVGTVIVDDSADRLSLTASYQVTREQEPRTIFVVWNLS
jgi:Holliday junction resolvase RusA-like endonuclease